MKTIILGAGLTGLSAAHHGGGVIYEKEREIGGTSRSVKIKGYTFDLGIHVLHTSNVYVLGLLNKRLKASLGIQRRRAWIYSYNTLTGYPFQVNTYGLPVRIVRECLLGFIKASNKNKANYDNYEDWIHNSFGRGVAEHFLAPYSKKFWTVPPQKMTADWQDLRVPMPKLEDVVAGALSAQKKGFGPNWRFRYPEDNGIVSLPNAFGAQNSNIFLNKQALEIDINKKMVKFKDGSRVKYSKLISTIALPELIKIISNSPQKIFSASLDLKYNSIFCVNLGLNRANLNNAHWIYYPQDDYSFFRISFPKNFLKSLSPRGKSSIMAEVAYSPYKRINKKTIVDRVIKDLIRGKIITRRDKIDLIDTRDIKYGYVIYDHNRRGNLSVIKKFLTDNGIYTAGRYGSWEYYWMDDSILDGKRAAELL